MKTESCKKACSSQVYSSQYERQSKRSAAPKRLQKPKAALVTAPTSTTNTAPKTPVEWTASPVKFVQNTTIAPAPVVKSSQKAIVNTTPKSQLTRPTRRLLLMPLLKLLLLLNRSAKPVRFTYLTQLRRCQGHEWFGCYTGDKSSCSRRCQNTGGRFKQRGCGGASSTALVACGAAAGCGEAATPPESLKRVVHLRHQTSALGSRLGPPGAGALHGGHRLSGSGSGGPHRLRHQAVLHPHRTQRHRGQSPPLWRMRMRNLSRW